MPSELKGGEVVPAPLLLQRFSEAHNDEEEEDGAILLPCLTPTQKGIVVSISPIINLTLLSAYILTIE